MKKFLRGILFYCIVIVQFLVIVRFGIFFHGFIQVSQRSYRSLKLFDEDFSQIVLESSMLFIQILICRRGKWNQFLQSFCKNKTPILEKYNIDRETRRRSSFRLRLSLTREAVRLWGLWTVQKANATIWQSFTLASKCELSRKVLNRSTKLRRNEI